MKLHYVIGVVCLCLVLVGCAGNYITIPDQYQDAYQTLVTTEGFSYMGIGVSGQVPDFVRAFSDLYFSGNAKDYFLHLTNEKTDAAKLYALCGLYHLDKYSFDILVKRYQNISTPIHRAEGCIPTIIPMNQIISATNPNQMDIKHGKIPQFLLDYIS